MENLIRPVVPNDISAIKTIIDASELFPSDLLDEMICDYFTREDSQELWLTYAIKEPLAIAYCAPERMTEGTWNLYLIAVHPQYQGQGIGTSMVHYIEQLLAKQGERILLIETSSLASFEPTQKFYRQCGYELEARIRDFYQGGEDKLVFRKSLSDCW